MVAPGARPARPAIAEPLLVAPAVVVGADLLHRQLASQRRHRAIERDARPVDRPGFAGGLDLRAQVPILFRAGSDAATEQHVGIGARVDPRAGEGIGRGRAAVDYLHHLDAVAGGPDAGAGPVDDAQRRGARCRAAVHHQLVGRRSVRAKVRVQRQRAGLALVIAGDGQPVPGSAPAKFTRPLLLRLPAMANAPAPPPRPGKASATASVPALLTSPLTLP